MISIEMQTALFILLSLRSYLANEINYMNSNVGYTALYDVSESIQKGSQAESDDFEDKKTLEYLNAKSSPSDQPIIVPNSSFMLLPVMAAVSRSKRSVFRRRNRKTLRQKYFRRLNCSLPNTHPECITEGDGSVFRAAAPSQIAACYLYHYSPVECRLNSDCYYDCATKLCTTTEVPNTECSIHCGDPCGCTSRQECQWNPDPGECVAATPFSKIYRPPSPCTRPGSVYSVRGVAGVSVVSGEVKRENCKLHSTIVGINFGSDQTIDDAERIVYEGEKSYKKLDFHQIYEKKTFNTGDKVFATGITSKAQGTCRRVGERCIVYRVPAKGLAQGTYELGLKMFDAVSSKPGERRFTVRFGGKTLLHQFDSMEYTGQKNTPFTVYADMEVENDTLVIGSHDKIKRLDSLPLEICTGACGKNQAFFLNAFYIALFLPTGAEPPSPPPPTVEPPAPPPENLCDTSWLRDAKTGLPGGGNKESGEDTYICRYMFDGVYYHGEYSDGVCLIWGSRLYFQKIEHGYELLQDSPKDSFTWTGGNVGNEFPKGWKLVLGTGGDKLHRNTYIVICKIVKGNDWRVGHLPENKTPYYFVEGNNTQQCPDDYQYLTCGENKPDSQ